ncbi:MAG: hypothetical protein AB7T06_42115 [Kofleriaceae bacterium]
MTERRARQFADAVAHKLVELVPGATVIAEDTALIIDGHRISLDGYISAYVDASWFGRRSVVRRTANAIADELAGYDVLDSYDAALRALRARLTTDAAMDLLRLAYLGAPNSDSPARPVFRALGSDLVAEPILDRSHDLIRVHQWMLARWAVPEKELLDDAVRAMRSGKLTFSDIGGLRACGPANAIFIVEALLDHAAQDLPRSARELYADWTELFNFTPTRAVVMAPQEDVLFVFDRDDVRAWTLAVLFTHACVLEGDALSAAVLERTDQRWVERAPPLALDPDTRNLLAEAALEIRLRRYETQRAAIVAAYPHLDAPPIKRVGSQTVATFTRGRAAALPVSDRVALIDPARPENTRELAWNELATTKGLVLENFAATPPRVQLSGWPQ